MSWPWLTADSSEQALWNYTLIPAWIYSGVCIFFLFWLSIVFFLSDPLSLSLIFVYWSPNTSFLEVSIYFSHSLSCSCWLSHHFYLYLLPLSLSLIFFSVAFFFSFKLSVSHPTPTLPVQSLVLPWSKLSGHIAHFQTFLKWCYSSFLPMLLLLSRFSCVRLCATP